MAIKATTQGLIATVTTVSGIFLIPEVHNALLPLVGKHPDLIALLGAATTVASLLHNPQVCGCFKGASQPAAPVAQ